MIRLLLACLLTSSLTFAQWTPEVLWDQSGAQDTARYGWRVLALGDQNDDGYADFAVWAQGNAGINGVGPPGRVELFHGGNPPSTIPYHVFTLDSTLTVIYDARVAGDINGDGYKDLLLEFEWHGDWHTRSAYVFYGGPMLDSQPDARLPPYPYAFFGWSGPVGDFNGDGFDDLYLRFSHDDSTRIYFGGNPPDTLSDWVRHSPPAQVDELSPYSAGGDLDADGYADWISNTILLGGQLFAYMGGAAPDTVPGSTIPLEPDWAALGMINDVNGDGRSEVLTSHGGYAAAVRFGQRPLRPEVDVQLDLPAERVDGFQSAGDVNGDGYGDFLAGGRYVNYVALYLGGLPLRTTPVWTRTGAMVSSEVRSFRGVGDVNGDGAADFAVGFNGDYWPMRHGRVLIFGGDTTLPVTPQGPAALLPQSLTVSAYPNPFNSTTEIRYALPRFSHVSLKVFDVAGREVAAPVDRVVAAGEQRVQWNAEGVASGVYFVRLDAGEQTITRKVLLVR